MLNPRDLHADSELDAELLPVGWKRIPLDDPFKIITGWEFVRSADPPKDGAEGWIPTFSGGFTKRDAYEMHQVVREWCREQFGYEPVIYVLPINYSGYTASSVFTDSDHAMLFTLRWL